MTEHNNASTVDLANEFMAHDIEFEDYYSGTKMTGDRDDIQDLIEIVNESIQSQGGSVRVEGLKDPLTDDVENKEVAIWME